MRAELDNKLLEEKLVQLPNLMRQNRVNNLPLGVNSEANAVNLLIHALGIQGVHAEDVKAGQKPFIARDCTVLVRKR